MTFCEFFKTAHSKNRAGGRPGPCHSACLPELVERAKGILQQKYNTTEEDAYFRLRNQSRRLRRPMRDLAEAIILAEDIGREPDREA